MRRAFTLIELIAVMAIASTLAVVAASSVSAVERAGQSAFALDVERAVRDTRSVAMSSGVPAGVSLDLSAGALSFLTLDSAGATVIPRTGPTGDSAPDLRAGALHASAGISSFVHGDGATGDGSIWFDAGGSPQIRQGDGSFTPFTQNAAITCTDASVITVWMTTGAVVR